MADVIPAGFLPWSPLAEASDPRTSGERLMAITKPGSCGREGHNEIECAELHAAVYRNPSLPIDVLARCLVHFRGPNAVHVWMNPSAPLAMLTHPNGGYFNGARQTLNHLEVEHAEFSCFVRPLLLDHAVQGWASRPATEGPHARPFAHHLASLFNLSWPEET